MVRPMTPGICQRCGMHLGGDAMMCSSCSADVKTLASKIAATKGDPAAIGAVVRADRERRDAEEKIARLVATGQVRIVADPKTGSPTFEVTPERVSLARAVGRTVARWIRARK